MLISSYSTLRSTAPEVHQVRTVPGSPPEDEVVRQANPAAEDPRPERSVSPAEDIARLNESQVRQLRDLKARDREVRAHEQAHIAAGGSLVLGAARFSYQQGPDGRSYAIGGEVSIGSAEVPGDPERTAENAEQIQRAALAPASPSAQDRAIAAQAAATATKARAEAAQERRQETAEVRPAASPTGPDSARASESEGRGAARASRQSEIAAYESVAALGEGSPPAATDTLEPALPAVQVDAAVAVLA